jgi:hypothetical protein
MTSLAVSTTKVDGGGHERVHRDGEGYRQWVRLQDVSLALQMELALQLPRSACLAMRPNCISIVYGRSMIR